MEVEVLSIGIGMGHVGCYTDNVNIHKGQRQSLPLPTKEELLHITKDIARLEVQLNKSIDRLLDIVGITRKEIEDQQCAHF